MAVLLIKRGTRAQLDAAALAGTLILGEPYLITDEARIAVGTSAYTYDETARVGELASAQANQEATQQELLTEAIYYLAAILDKLPRTDGNDRVFVSHAESNPTVSIATAQTLATLTTLQTLGSSSRPADAVPMHVANAGALHLYDRITVS